MNEVGLEELKGAVLTFDGEKAEAVARRLIDRGLTRYGVRKHWRIA